MTWMETSTQSWASSPGRVQTGDNVMIGGLIVGGGGGGGGSTKVIVRAIGPSIAAVVPGALGDPTLALHDGNGTVITTDNWRSHQEAEIIASGIAPTEDLESALVRSLTPGPYTAIVRGVNEMTGVALVEVYSLD